jgi:hypothetical protein
VGFRIVHPRAQGPEGVAGAGQRHEEPQSNRSGGGKVILLADIQPIKDRVHPAYEYCGQSDPTREVNRKVSREEMAARVSQI